MYQQQKLCEEFEEPCFHSSEEASSLNDTLILRLRILTRWNESFLIWKSNKVIDQRNDLSLSQPEISLTGIHDMICGDQFGFWSLSISSYLCSGSFQQILSYSLIKCKSIKWWAYTIPQLWHSRMLYVYLCSYTYSSVAQGLAIYEVHSYTFLQCTCTAWLHMCLQLFSTLCLSKR